MAISMFLVNQNAIKVSSLIRKNLKLHVVNHYILSINEKKH